MNESPFTVTRMPSAELLRAIEQSALLERIRGPVERVMEVGGMFIEYLNKSNHPLARRARQRIAHRKGRRTCTHNGTRLGR